MTYENIVKKLRMFLADDKMIIWSDEDLQLFIEEAIRQYSMDCGFFCRSFSFHPESNGIYKVPDDFSKLLIAWNDQGHEITITNTVFFDGRQYEKNLSAGPVRYIYSDLSSSGDYKLLPEIANSQNLEYAVFSDIYGEVEDNQFGVFEDDKFGISCDIFEYDFVGDAVYQRIANIEEIKDYMPIIYYAMSIAYSGDYEYSNAQMAEIYLARYKQRIAAYDTVRKDLHGKLNLHTFY